MSLIAFSLVFPMEAMVGKIPESLIVQVADEVTTINDCEHLAVCVTVPLDEVESAQQSGITQPQQLALHILRQWVKKDRQGATVSKLLRAFNKPENKRLRYLTEVLKHHLEKKGNSFQV